MAGLAGLGNICAHDWDPLVRLLILHAIIATMNRNWNDLADEFGILFDE